MKFLTEKLISDPNITPETRDRIAKVQKRLEESGVVNIHFSWNYEQLAKDKPALDKVANAVCQMLEDDLDGKMTYEEVKFNDKEEE